MRPRRQTVCINVVRYSSMLMLNEASCAGTPSSCSLQLIIYITRHTHSLPLHFLILPCLTSYMSLSLLPYLRIINHLFQSNSTLRKTLSPAILRDPKTHQPVSHPVRQTRASLQSGSIGPGTSGSCVPCGNLIHRCATGWQRQRQPGRPYVVTRLPSILLSRTLSQPHRISSCLLACSTTSAPR